MFVQHSTDIPPMEVQEGAKNTTIRWLIAEREGAPNFYMRLIEIGAGGNTPDHAHEWEHEVFILEGEGKPDNRRRVLLQRFWGLCKLRVVQ